MLEFIWCAVWLFCQDGKNANALCKLTKNEDVYNVCFGFQNMPMISNIGIIEKKISGLVTKN